MTSVRMRDYELVMILSPEATEAEAAETVSRITVLISDGGGSVSQQDNWGIRRLAYPIQRFIEGNYFIARCKMDAQVAVDLDSTLNSSQDVLRHLVFRLDKSDLAAMEKQAERENAARQETERRATAEREARARDEARRSAEAAARAAASEAAAAETAPVQAEAAPVQAEASAEAESDQQQTAPVQPEASAEAAPAQAETPSEASEDVSTSVDEPKTGE